MIDQYVSDVVEREGFNPELYFDFLRMADEFKAEQELNEVFNNEVSSTILDDDLPF